MKKYFVISAFLCGIMMLFNSCSKSVINMAVDALNTGCPKQVNDIVVMDSATYQNNVITINYTVDDALASIDSLNAITDIIKNQVLLRFQTDPNMKDFVQTCHVADVTIKNVYTGKTSGKTFTIDITKEDAEAVLYGKVVPLPAPDSTEVREVEESAEGAVNRADQVIQGDVQRTETLEETE